MREHVSSYAFGAMFLAATLWMTFAIPRYLAEAIDTLSQDHPGDEGDFTRLVGWIAFFAVAIVVTRTASRLLFFTPGRRAEFDLKNRLLIHLSRLQRDFYTRNPSGSIISRINNDVNGVRMLLGSGLMTLLSTAGTLSLAPYYMYAISPRLTLYSALPLIAGFAALQVALRRMRKYQVRHMTELQHLSQFTVEGLNGVDVLKSYRGYGWAEQSFGEISANVCKAAIGMSNIRAYFMPMLLHLTNGLKVVVVLIGGALVIREGMTIGEFTAFMLYLSMLVSPLMGMTFMLFVLQRGLTGLGSLLEVFDADPGLPAPEPNARVAPSLKEGLSVRALSYAYPDEPDRAVLTDVTFSVGVGEVVGVFGAVGSGKSTLVNLINGYLTPSHGAVFLDGVDALVLGQTAVRRHIVTVAQEPFLFSDTIAENIALAVDDVERETLRAAVERGALTPDLARMSAGIETVVGEKGITLSGGQKQRIALARATMVSCDLLLLDDVLSAVDHETERYLIDQIYRFAHAASTLLVSHRISALERANQIIVLGEGRVLDRGTHAELIARAGSYQDAWRLQTSDTRAHPE